MAGSPATVLICDDEPALRELIRVSIRGEYAFAEAEDGVECMKLVREIHPDVLILDMLMPRRGGLEVLTELRGDVELAAMPVIVLTAQPETREDALREGATLVMDKPFSPDEISEAVEGVLAESG
ncbi:MAG TPA: response regulator [Gaiellaceae bacterium]|jgi:CheY-like chemotaxis protein|nr:response regulator [Gaiellaceae bacterium]